MTQRCLLPALHGGVGLAQTRGHATLLCREGRVLQETGKDAETGLYVVGWAKRGPTGIIGETNNTRYKGGLLFRLALIFDYDVPGTALD